MLAKTLRAMFRGPWAFLMRHLNSLNDLPSLDAELYKNLMFLKNYSGDVEVVHRNAKLEFTNTLQSD
eukprot:5317541-Amphidinium_carterae.1